MGLAAYSFGVNIYDYQQGKINKYEFFSEEITNVISVAGREYGAAFGIGWSLGHIIANTDLYQKMKFNFYYNYWEKRATSLLWFLLIVFDQSVA